MTTVGLIVDISVVALIVLLVIFGTWRGMYKLIFGLVSGLLSIVLAIVLMGTITNFIVKRTELEDSLRGAIDQPVLNALPADLDAENVHVVFTDDAITVVNNTTGDTYESISDYVSQTGSSLAPMASVLDSLTANETVREAYTTTDDDGKAVTSSPTLADLLCMTVTTYVLLAISFVVLWIVGFIVVRLLLMLLKNIVTRTYVGHFLNKVLGFVIGAAIGLIIVWGALAVIRLLGTYTWIISVNNVINGSTITKWLFENNFLYSFLVDTMNLQDTISGIVGSFSSPGATGASGS